MPVHPEGYQDLARAPEQWLSVHKSIEEARSPLPSSFRGLTLTTSLQSIQAKYTTMTATADARDNIQIPPIKGQLTRLLDELVPEVHDEIKAAFDDEFPSSEEGMYSSMLCPCCESHSFASMVSFRCFANNY